MIGIALMVRNLDMPIWIFYKSTALIKSLSPFRKVVDRWVNFQNARLLLQCSENSLSILLIPHRGLDTKMLDIPKLLKLPI